MRARDDVRGDDLADATGGGCARALLTAATSPRTIAVTNPASIFS
jgi:hypothetical protein